MIFTWSFWAFYDIPGPGKYVFSHSVCGKSTRYSNRLHDFSVAISECYNDILKRDKGDNINTFFPLTYDLNVFTSRVNTKQRWSMTII